MKSFDGAGCMFKVASGVSDSVVFRRVAGPLGPILELDIVESRVDDFVEFLFVLSFYLNSMRGFLNLSGKLVFFVGFEKRDVECVVYSHQGR